MIDIERVRQDCRHCRDIVHLNNAGCALSPDKVSTAVLDHLRLEQKIGGYEAATTAAADIDDFYPAVAEMLNCDSGEIAFAENATRAWDLALHSLPWKAGDQIITGEMEYASNYLGLLHLARRLDLEIVTVPCDESGLIDLQRLTEACTPRTRLLALTHVASQRGDIQPAAEVGRIARDRDIVFLLDACQSVGQLGLDVRELGCDLLCGTGRKYLRGPRGTGFLYVNRSRLEQLQPIFVDLQSASWESKQEYRWLDGARRFENFERFVAGQIGLATAVRYATALGFDAIEARIQHLLEALQQRLTDIPAITVHERSPHRSGIVTLSHDNENARSLQSRLHSHGINTSLSQRVNARLDLDRENLDDVLRVSLHYYNTEAELDRLASVIEDA